MWPDFSYVLHDILNCNTDIGLSAKIKTYGFFQTISFVSFYFLTLRILVKNNLADAIIDLRIIKITISIFLLFYLQVFFSINYFVINLLLSIGVLNVNCNDSFSIKYFFFLVFILICGVCGSAFQLAFENYSKFGSFTVKNGHGFFGASISIFIILNLLYYNKKSLLMSIFYEISPFVYLSYGIGKLGCHLSGDGDWGIINKYFNENSFLYNILTSNYPRNVINAGLKIEGCNFKYCTTLANNVYSLPLYESFISIIGFIILSRSKTIRQRISLAFIIIGVMRFLTEFINDNIIIINFYKISLTYSQIISLCFVIMGVLILLPTNYFKDREYF